MMEATHRAPAAEKSKTSLTRNLENLPASFTVRYSFSLIDLYLRRGEEIFPGDNLPTQKLTTNPVGDETLMFFPP
jgi:hypothetical protein